MCFIFSFVPATFWAIIGYFVLFSSTKAEGRTDACDHKRYIEIRQRGILEEVA